MKNKQLLFIAAAATLAFSACKPHLDTTAPNAGNLDFTRYVAVGNSLTAGYADGSLYRSGQMNAYPALLSSAFNQVMPSSYKAPLLPGESGWPIIPAAGYYPRRILGPSADCQGNVSLGPVFYPAPYDTAGSSVSIAAQGPYNNLGVPGIRAIDYLLPSYPALNSYSSRFFTNLLGRPTEELSRIQPTFFTAWIGNNDVLAYATSGGSGKSSGGSFADMNSISGTTLFSVAVDSVLNRLSPGGTTPGAVMNIPDVTAIPFFTTVPYNGLVLRQGQADTLNRLYQIAGIRFTAGANPFIIQDNSVPFFKYRQIKPGELVLLTVPQDSLKCAGWGSAKPIPAQYILDATEIAAVMSATTTFNSILSAECMSRHLAYVDVNTYLKTVNAGILFNGVTLNSTFVTGGAFSLDGVHLTPRGNALVANEILRTINSYYGVSLPMLDVNAYNGIAFP